MKRTLLLLLLIVLIIAVESSAQQLAFPGAEGFGRFTQGGRGGKVIKVTNLNDNGPGSLRAAIEAHGPRIVVFDVSGLIELESTLLVCNPYITIAGQSAPGDGICLKNYPLVVKNAHDVIIRFLRIRPGIGSGKAVDALDIEYSSNIIVDHCSMGWSIDEIINARVVNKNITVQWCILSESLNHSIHHKGEHGYAATLGSQRASYHHNLLANNKGRNPSIGGSDKEFTAPINFTNNVIFNYSTRGIDGKPNGINVINNYYKPGPATFPDLKPTFAKIDNSTEKCLPFFYHNWYIAGNIVDGYTEVQANNWKHVVLYTEGTSEELNKAKTPFDDGGYKLRTANETYSEVLQYAGAFLPKRDNIDKRAINDTRTGIPEVGNGIIDRVEQVGGWPKYKTYKVLSDTDNDGMPDEWELEKGLNPRFADDANADSNHNGYTNIENYLNNLVPSHSDTKPGIKVIKPTNEVFALQGNTTDIPIEVYASDYNGGNIVKMQLFLNATLIKEVKNTNKITETLKNIKVGMHHIVVRAVDNTNNLSVDTSTIFVGKKKLKIDVSKTTNGFVKLSPAGGVYADGIHVNITPIPNKGYRFYGWTKDLECKQKDLSIITSENLNLEALFIPEKSIEERYSESIKINFQPEDGKLPKGYIPEAGRWFKDIWSQYNFGHMYGWIDGKNYPTGKIVGKEGAWSDFVNFDSPGEGSVWELELPHGRYRVKLGLGGKIENIGLRENNIYVEGILVKDKDGADLIDEHILENLTVSDGRLTLRNAGQSRVCFIEIELIELINEQKLIVNNGNGSGSYQAMQRVLISADPPASGMIFDKWSGDTQQLDNVYSPSTFVSMQSNLVKLTANYKSGTTPRVIFADEKKVTNTHSK